MLSLWTSTDAVYCWYCVYSELVVEVFFSNSPLRTQDLKWSLSCVCLKRNTGHCYAVYSPEGHVYVAVSCLIIWNYLRYPTSACKLNLAKPKHYFEWKIHSILCWPLYVYYTNVFYVLCLCRTNMSVLCLFAFFFSSGGWLPGQEREPVHPEAHEAGGPLCRAGPATGGDGTGLLSTTIQHSTAE